MKSKRVKIELGYSKKGFYISELNNNKSEFFFTDTDILQLLKIKSLLHTKFIVGRSLNSYLDGIIDQILKDSEV